MTAYTALMLEAQRIITSAENRYESARFNNGGDVTPEMEEAWYEALKRAEVIQAEAAREMQYEQQLAHDERMEEEYLRHGL